MCLIFRGKQRMMDGEKFYYQDVMNGGAIMDFFNEIGKKFTKAARSVQDLTRG